MSQWRTRSLSVALNTCIWLARLGDGSTLISANDRFNQPKADRGLGVLLDVYWELKAGMHQMEGFLDSGLCDGA